MNVCLFCHPEVFTEAPNAQALLSGSAKRWWHQEGRSQTWVYRCYTLRWKGGLSIPYDLLTPRSLQPSSLCFIAPLQPGVNHFSAVICQEFLSLFCCHFITGSSYQPAQSHVTWPGLSWAPVLLIRDHHEIRWMVYRGSLMLKKEQSPFNDVPVTFWIIGFSVCVVDGLLPNFHWRLL